MPEKTQHTMQLEKTHPTGAEEWFCPLCGRRFVLLRAPEYKKIILDDGLEEILHLGEQEPPPKPQPRTRRIFSPDDDDPADLSDPTLKPWKDWAEKTDLDSLWEDNSP